MVNSPLNMVLFVGGGSFEGGNLGTLEFIIMTSSELGNSVGSLFPVVETPRSLEYSLRSHWVKDAI